MTIQTIIGKTYAVTSTTECTVTTPDGALIATCQPGVQTCIVSPTTEIEISDNNALVTESFKGASAGSAAGGGVQTIYDTTSTQTPPEGDLNNYNAYGWVMVVTQSGRLDAITIQPRSGGVIKDTFPVYLKIWTQEDNKWQLVGTSANSVTQVMGGPFVWQFYGIQLEAGQKLRIDAHKSKQDLVFDACLSVRVVANVQDDTGIIDSRGVVTDTRWVPQYTLTLSNETGIAVNGIRIGNGLTIRSETVDGKKRATLETDRNFEVDSLSVSGVTELGQTTKFTTNAGRDFSAQIVASTDDGGDTLNFYDQFGDVALRYGSSSLQVHKNLHAVYTSSFDGNSTFNNLATFNSSLIVGGDLQFGRGENGYIFDVSDSDGYVYRKWQNIKNNTSKIMMMYRLDITAMYGNIAIYGNLGCDGDATFRSLTVNGISNFNNSVTFSGDSEFLTIIKAKAGIAFDDTNLANPFTVIVPTAEGVVIGRGGASTSVNKTKIIFDQNTEISFSGTITILAPVSDNNPATKKYVDDAIAAGSGSGGTWDGGTVNNTSIFNNIVYFCSSANVLSQLTFGYSGANPYVSVVTDQESSVVTFTRGEAFAGSDLAKIVFDDKTNVNLDGVATRSTKANPDPADLMNKEMVDAAIAASGGGSGGTCTYLSGTAETLANTSIANGTYEIFLKAMNHTGEYANSLFALSKGDPSISFFEAEGSGSAGAEGASFSVTWESPGEPIGPDGQGYSSYVNWIKAHFVWTCSTGTLAFLINGGGTWPHVHIMLRKLA